MDVQQNRNNRIRLLLAAGLVTLALLACAVEVDEAQPGIPPRTTVVTLTPALASTPAAHIGGTE